MLPQPSGRYSGESETVAVILHAVAVDRYRRGYGFLPT